MLLDRKAVSEKIPVNVSEYIVSMISLSTTLALPELQLVPVHTSHAARIQFLSSIPFLMSFKFHSRIFCHVDFLPLSIFSLLPQSPICLPKGNPYFLREQPPRHCHNTHCAAQSCVPQPPGGHRRPGSRRSKPRLSNERLPPGTPKAAAPTWRSSAGSRGETPLHGAAFNGAAEAVVPLLDLRSAVDAVNCDGSGAQQGGTGGNNCDLFGLRRRMGKKEH